MGISWCQDFCVNFTSPRTCVISWSLPFPPPPHIYIGNNNEIIDFCDVFFHILSTQVYIISMIFVHSTTITYTNGIMETYPRSVDFTWSREKTHSPPPPQKKSERHSANRDCRTLLLFSSFIYFSACSTTLLERSQVTKRAFHPSSSSTFFFFVRKYIHYIKKNNI